MWAFTFTVLYVLSIGPVAKVGGHFGLPHTHPQAAKVVQAFYSPIVLVVENYPAAGRLLVWYLHDVWRVPITGP